jgi:hypothetical protein
VYVSMCVFVTLHLNPHHTFVCFFGLFIAGLCLSVVLPFFRGRPFRPPIARNRPGHGGSGRLALPVRYNSLANKLKTFFTELSALEDETITFSRNFGYQPPSSAMRYPKRMESSSASLLKRKDSKVEFIYT